MKQAFGNVNKNGSVRGGSDNFVVRKDENKAGIYYIDSDVFKGKMPSFAATPYSLDLSACVLYTNHWYTGTIEIRTGSSDKSGYLDCSFSFIATNI